MNCKNCGRQLRDTDKFCPACGTMVEQAAPVYVEPAATQPAPEKKGINLIAVGAGLLAVIVAAVVLLSGMFGSDVKKLAKAVVKSGGAYAEAMEALKLENVKVSKEEYSVDMNLGLVDVADAEELNGFGLDVRMDYNKSKQHMGLTLVPSYTSLDLVEVQLQLRGAELYAGVPQLTGSTYYMIRTDILGQELSALGADMAGAETLGFNVFELVDRFEAIAANNQEQMKTVAEVVKAQAKLIQVEKTGKASIDVNGIQTDAQAYHVLIPQQCVTAVLDALEPVYLSSYSNEDMLELYRAIGMPEEMVAMMRESMAETAGYAAESFAQVREALAQLGDLELDVYVSDGYVVAVDFSITADDVTVNVHIALGGREEYVNDFSITALDQNGEGLQLICQGDHGAKKGAYTSHMLFNILEAGERYEVMNWNLRYAPAEQMNNFTFSMTVEDEMNVDLMGQLSWDKNEVLVDMEEISVYAYGEKLATFALECRIGAYEPQQVDTTNHMVLTQMTEADMQNAMNEISRNAMIWLTWLQENCPDLLAMLM